MVDQFGFPANHFNSKFKNDFYIFELFFMLQCRKFTDRETRIWKGRHWSLLLVCCGQFLIHFGPLSLWSIFDPICFTKNDQINQRSRWVWRSKFSPISIGKKYQKLRFLIVPRDSRTTQFGVLYRFENSDLSFLCVRVLESLVVWTTSTEDKFKPIWQLFSIAKSTVSTVSLCQ